MRHIFIDKKGISNVLGYLFSFAIASLVMISAVLLTTNIIDERTAKVGNMEAQSIANKIADGIIEAVAVGESTSNMDYNKVLDIPTDIAGRNYYVEVTDRAVYVNTTDGLVSKSCPTYGAESSKIGLSRGKFYGGSGKINITLSRPDNVYKFDFGTGNITSHSPVESGYYMVTNTSSTKPKTCAPPWWNPDYIARVPILVNNDSPENLINTPIKVVLSSSNFDYSLANVTVDSSSEVTSNLKFVDPSSQIIAKINITNPSWDPSWFYTYYTNPIIDPVEFKITELSGGYNASYIDWDTVKLKAKGETLATSWDSSTGIVKFNAVKALEILENDGTHFLSSLKYTVTVYGLLKNGLEFSGSGTISIKNAIHVFNTQNQCNIGDAITENPGCTTFFIHNLPPEEYYSDKITIDRKINLIGQSRDGVILFAATNNIYVITVSASEVNIDSLTVEGFSENGLILVQGGGYSKINITNCQLYNGVNGIKIISGSNIGISNCITKLNDEDGIHIETSWNIRITNCESYYDDGDGFDITNCHDISLLNNCKSYANTGDNGNGILLTDSYNCVISDSLISSNNGNNGDGIHIATTNVNTGSYNNQIINCTISNQDGSFDNNAGIYIEDGPSSLSGPYNIIKNCKICNNKYGIAAIAYLLGYACENYIEGCSIYNNSFIGIKLNSENIGSGSFDNHIIDCNVYENGYGYSGTNKGGCGIFLWGSNSNYIHGCNIFDNGNDGLRLDGGIFAWSSGNTITNNNFYGNGKENASGTGVYCGGTPKGAFGSNENIINHNNFGFEYNYSKNCIDYNAKYALDDYNNNTVWGWANNWSSNYWGNNPSGAVYKIPNTKMDNSYNNGNGNRDTSPSSSPYPNPDYIVVTPTSQATPPITIKINGTGKTYDTTLYEKLSDYQKPHGGDTNLWVDPWYGYAIHRRNHILIKFDLSDIPAGSTITSANLYLYYMDYSGTDPKGRVYKCDKLYFSPWLDISATWDMAGGFSWYDGSTCNVPTYPNTPNSWMHWDVKNDVAGFVKTNNPDINEGWLIKDQADIEPAQISDSYAAEFYSSNYVGVNKPYLEVTYSPPSNDPGPHYHPRTIAKGIGNVIVGGTVYVKENFTTNHPYNETLTIGKRLNLIGKNKYTTIINSKGASQDAITVESPATFVNISGFTINNSNSGIKLESSTGSNKKIKIEDCILKDNNYGIDIIDNSGNQRYIRNCSIDHNSYGIYVSGSKNVNVENCDIYSNTQDGIYISGSQSNKIKNCNVHLNNQHGIYITGNTAKGNFISYCNIYSNAIGINFENVQINKLTPNYVENSNINSNGFGISIESSAYLYTQDCDIYSNTQQGIHIADGTYNEITKCSIRLNSISGVNITGASYNNRVYGCKFLQNGVNGWDTNSNAWDSDSSSNGGNLWDNYDEPSEGAYDNNGDGIADQPYNVPGGGTSKDNYPWCRKPAEMPYYIDYWNPYGESVILINMSLANYTSKYIYLYYGYSGSLSNPKYKHNVSEVSVFSDDFNGVSINTNKWTLLPNTPPYIHLDGYGNLIIPYYHEIISKFIIQDIGAPTEIPYIQTLNQSMYIVETRINISNSSAYVSVLGGAGIYPNFELYGIALNLKNENLFINKSHSNPVVVRIPNLNHWIRLKAYVYRTYEKYSTNQAYANESKHFTITGIIYDPNSYASEANISYSESKWKIGLSGSWEPPDKVIDTTYKLAVACWIIPPVSIDPIQVDWIRVMKAPVIPPTITIGPVESVNCGWDNPSAIHSKNIVLPGQQPSDDPFVPGPVLRDFNYGNIAGVFNITNLPQDEYTITVTMGNASGACNKTTVEFRDNRSTTLYGTLTIPATEAGKFETKWLPINFKWSGTEKRNLKTIFSAEANKNWTVNSMIIERGKKGIHVGLE